MQRELESLRVKVSRMEELSQDNINLTVENQRLSKALSASRDSQSRVLELEADVEEREKEISSLKGTLTQFEGDRSRLHDLEVKMYTADEEVHKLNRSVDLCNKKVGGATVRKAKISTFTV